jgi:NADH dehydrogenase (ubiquinone) Fe-S protein 2
MAEHQVPVSTLHMSVQAVFIKISPLALMTFYQWATQFGDRIDENRGASDNRIRIGPTTGIGVVSTADALNYSFTGVMLRGSGVPWDVRKSPPYHAHGDIEFDVPVGVNGDCYDRHLCRGMASGNILVP